MATVAGTNLADRRLRRTQGGTYRAPQYDPNPVVGASRDNEGGSGRGSQSRNQGIYVGRPGPGALAPGLCVQLLGAGCIRGRHRACPGPAAALCRLVDRARIRAGGAGAVVRGAGAAWAAVGARDRWNAHDVATVWRESGRETRAYRGAFAGAGRTAAQPGKRTPTRRAPRAKTQGCARR